MLNKERGPREDAVNLNSTCGKTIMSSCFASMFTSSQVSTNQSLRLTCLQPNPKEPTEDIFAAFRSMALVPPKDPSIGIFSAFNQF